MLGNQPMGKSSVSAPAMALVRAVRLSVMRSRSSTGRARSSEMRTPPTPVPASAPATIAASTPRSDGLSGRITGGGGALRAARTSDSAKNRSTVRQAADPSERTSMKADSGDGCWLPPARNGTGSTASMLSVTRPTPRAANWRRLVEAAKPRASARDRETEMPGTRGSPS